MTTKQRQLAQLNRRFGNKMVGGILPRMPGFGAVVHVGRKSGREYRTPVKVLRSGDNYVISLPYGPDSDWVKNVIAAGGCTLFTRGKPVKLADPRVFVDPEQVSVPKLIRPVLARFGGYDFIELRPVQGLAANSAS